MEQIILVKYGEIILKGLNRPLFEDILVRNIRAALRGLNPEITKAQATTYIRLPEAAHIPDAMERLTKVFGIVSVTRAYVLPKEIRAIAEGTADCLAPELAGARTFKVEAKRSDKKFPLKSPEICREVGGWLCSKFPHLSVNVKTPEKTVMVEVRDTNAYVYCDKMKGPGGMPVGTNSKAVLLLSGGIDSPVAGYMAAKRGVALEAVHFFSHPYTSDRAKERCWSLRKSSQHTPAG